MVLPRRMARLNRVGLNRVARHIAPRLPGFGLVLHQGRRSGRTYRTPVNLFPIGDDVRIALTYGPESDWVRNVLAAGGCQVRTRGRTMELTSPRLVRDPGRAGIGPLPRTILDLTGVEEFLDLSRSPAP